MKNMVDSYRSMRKKMLSPTSIRMIKLLSLMLMFIFALGAQSLFLMLLTAIVILLEY